MLPSVSWVIDGWDTPLQGWSAGTTAFGGFSQMRGVIKESDARRYPSTVGQGSTVTGYTQGGLVVYQGRLSAPPAIRGGLASFAAQGESVRAAKRATRLLYQSRDVSGWVPISNPPYSYILSGEDNWQYQADPSALKWETPAATPIANGEDLGFVFAAPGTPGGITKVTFTFRQSALVYGKITGYLGSYPGLPDGFSAGTETAPQVTTGPITIGFGPFGDGGGTRDRYDLRIACDTVTQGVGNPQTWGRWWGQMYDIRVNGIASSDTYTGSQVVTDIGGRLGYDTSKVLSTGLNVLPLDWTQGSWAELLSYIATLEDRYWRVVEDSRLEYDAWGTKEWTVYQADGATVDLTPLELYNQATVSYDDVGGAPRHVTVTCADLGIPDPLAASGIVNDWPPGGLKLADVQADATLATAVASNGLLQAATLKEAGRIDAVKAYDSTGREAVREIRAGDTIRVADREMNTATTHRVFETEQTPNGVASGIEGAVSVASLLGRAGLVAARAPSTMGLPALEPAAIEPSGIPSEEQQHRERFLTYPKAFAKKKAKR